MRHALHTTCQDFILTVLLITLYSPDGTVSDSEGADRLGCNFERHFNTLVEKMNYSLVRDGRGGGAVTFTPGNFCFENDLN
jgi:hypothetical protein